MKNVIWLIGSNGSGKTTQSILLHQHFNCLTRSEVLTNNPLLYRSKQKGINTSLSIFKYSSHVGKLQNTNCCGTDTISNKNSIIWAFNAAQKIGRPWTLIDGIMATGTWPDFLKKKDNRVNLVYLSFNSLEENIIRVNKRRGTEIMTDKTKTNLAGKVRGFESIYWNSKDRVDRSIKVDATLGELEIFEKIKKLIYE